MTKKKPKAVKHPFDKQFDQRVAGHAAKFENDMSEFGAKVFEAIEGRSALDAAIHLNEPLCVVQAALDHLVESEMLTVTDASKK